MNTALASVESISDAPLHREFSFGANVSLLQPRRDMRPGASIEISRLLEKETSCQQIIGNSPALQRVLELVKKVAPFDSTALLLGETGTGKELVAQAIHQRSPRCNGPFVKVNCSALPSELIASELFGHDQFGSRETTNYVGARGPKEKRHAVNYSYFRAAVTSRRNMAGQCLVA